MFISLQQFFVICFVLFNTVSGTPIAFKGLDGRTYVVEINPKYNWMEAYLWCADNGGQLLIIDSREKNDVVMNLLREKFQRFPNLWLGANDEYNISEGKGRRFVWSPTGKKMVYSHWSSLNPDNSAFSEHCLHMYSDTLWNDAPCENKMGFVCECVTERCLKLRKC